MFMRFLSTLLLAGVLLAGAALAEVAERVEYVEDIDAWRVEVWAGAANPGGILEGPRRQAGFQEPIQMCFFPTGEGFIATDGVILTLGKDRAAVRLLAGTPGLAGYRDGPAAQTLLGRQLGITPDGKGGLYIADRPNRCLRRARPEGKAWLVETVAGDPGKPPSETQLKRVRDEGPLEPMVARDVIDGTGKEARFSYLHSNVVADAAGNAYLMDSDFLRRVTPDGRVTTLNPKGGSGDPAKTQPELLESARFRLIMGGGLCLGPDGNLYVADRWNHCIRKVDLKGRTVSIAVGPGGGYRDGPVTECGFHDSPGHIVHDPYRGRFYTNGVDDWGLRTWENGRLKTIAGGGRQNRALSGPARQAGTHWCGVLAVDPLPPHDLYFWSNHPDWRGRIGRLYRTETPREKAP